jgi:hypothetical protein
MSAKKKQPTYKIPVNRHTKSVPSYTEGEYWINNRRERYEAELAAGFVENPGCGWTEESWTEYTKNRIKELEFDWVEPAEFTDTFEIKDWTRGRSAAGINLKSKTTGGAYYMMISNLFELLSTATISGGEVTGRWIVKKRGANYGIQYLGEANQWPAN